MDKPCHYSTQRLRVRQFPIRGSPIPLHLIDGQELTRLLVRYGVAVRTFQTVELKKIDLDYFSMEE